MRVHLPVISRYRGDRAQLDFLQHVQRILDEGGFVATYKFAPLIAEEQRPAGGFPFDREHGSLRQPALGLRLFGLAPRALEIAVMAS